MVKSNINPKVVYKETTEIEPDDLKYESFPYNIIFDAIDPYTPVQVIFGQLKTTHENDGVSYYPMYFLNKKNILHHTDPLFPCQCPKKIHSSPVSAPKRSVLTSPEP